MTKPLHPAIFCPIGLLLFIGSYYISKRSFLAGHTAILAFAFLSSLWSYQALRFLDDKPRWALRASRILLIALCLCELADFVIAWRLNVQPPDNTVYVLPAMVGVWAFFGLAALAALALRDAEGKPRESIMTAVMLFAFVDAVLFAPFLYARMERLADARR